VIVTSAFEAGGDHSKLTLAFAAAARVSDGALGVDVPAERSVAVKVVKPAVGKGLVMPVLV
jgi:hypothetical protein